MAYIGREPQIGNYQVCDAISVVNGQAAYTMQVSSTNVIPESVNHMIVSLNGVIQKPGSSYTIASSTITFSSNLATGDSIDFIYLLGNTLDLGTPSDDTVTGAKIVDNAINSEHYTDGSIDTAHIADGQVTTAKLSTAVFTGATDIGAAIVDADLFLMDDGAGGTIRKTTASRLKTYAAFNADAAQVFNESSNDVDFRVESNGNANMLFVDGGENAVGIGTGTPGAQLHIVGSDTTDQVIFENTDTGAGSAPDLVFYRNSSSPADNDILGRMDFRGKNDAGQDVDYFLAYATVTDVSDGTEDAKFQFEAKKAGSNAQLLGLSEAEVVVNDDSNDVDFRVESNGIANMFIVNGADDKIYINSDTNVSSEYLLIKNNYTRSGMTIKSNTASAHHAIEFHNTNNQVGYINTSGTSTVYSTSSDYRLKENVSYDFDATTRLKQLKPARFNFKSDTDKTVDGFIAHEVSSIVPEAISGEKDAVNEDGSIKPQGIDQSKLVPLLVKTIQELEARIKTLEDA